MPGIEELEAKLSQLSNDYYGDKQVKREDDFMNLYGSQFNGDRNLGLAVLEELDARGVDTSAAGEAVQQILDELRAQVSALATTLGMVENKVEEKIEEINKVSDAVNDALAKEGDTSVDMAEPPAIEDETLPADMPMDDTGTMPMEDPNAMPADMPIENETLPADMPIEDPNAMPMDQGMTLSDERMKRIKAAVSNKQTKPAKNSYVPSAGILEAAQRGW